MAHLTSYIILLRPRQWIKNLFIFAPLLFSLRFINPADIIAVMLAALCFILISSAVYIINDIHDIAEDQLHPQKKHRPLANGTIPTNNAILLAAFLISTAFITAKIWLNSSSITMIMLYFLLQILYTYHLKHIAIIDILIIATGFVMRVLTGAYAIEITASPWIIITTFLLALFIGFGKRYNEILINQYNKKRLSLVGYNKKMLNILIAISCASTLISYSLYAMETSKEIGKSALIFTILFVIFGLFRYLQAIYIKKQGGEPENIILKDKLFIANLTIWLITTISILIM